MSNINDDDDSNKNEMESAREVLSKTLENIIGGDKQEDETAKHRKYTVAREIYNSFGPTRKGAHSHTCPHCFESYDCSADKCQRREEWVCPKCYEKGHR